MKRNLVLALALFCILAACQSQPPTSIPITPQNYNNIALSARSEVEDALSVRWTPDSQSILVESKNTVII